VSDVCRTVDRKSGFTPDDHLVDANGACLTSVGQLTETQTVQDATELAQIYAELFNVNF